jgi:dCMP deaminase
MIEKHRYFMGLAILAANQSKCNKRHVGAVIVNDQLHVRAIGYNGVPRGFPHCVECKRSPSYITSALPNCPGIHAEQNALLQLEDTRFATSMYVTTFPCIHCAKMICNTNIESVYYMTDYNTDPQDRDTVDALFMTAKIMLVRLAINDKGELDYADSLGYRNDRP